MVQRELARRPAGELPPAPGAGTDPDAGLRVIEETARHAGPADILREQLDGTTGT